ncbi:hypothetical protein NDU88_002737 [Pleurodeles waltl]|uniref:Uncharacterized protein n=1 Tax=Pleurodeles waltl TaxID=8319 RepID=A0AAV7MQB0_PLEWA|nr:hypothetical protein NDU88_002737 [Pleurodeles waltl]
MRWAFWPESGRGSSAIPGLAATWRSGPQPAGCAEEERGPPAGICHPGGLAGALTPPGATAVCVLGPIPLGLDLRARRHQDRALISTHRFAPGLGTQTECRYLRGTGALTLLLSPPAASGGWAFHGCQDTSSDRPSPALRNGTTTR